MPVCDWAEAVPVPMAMALALSNEKTRSDSTTSDYVYDYVYHRMKNTPLLPTSLPMTMTRAVA